MSRARNYVFTLHEKDGETLRLLDPLEWPEYVTYLVYQMEVAPDTGRIHFQGYLELSEGKSMTALKDACPGLEDAWFGVRRGNQRQAIAYSKKDDTRVDGPWTHGAPKNQGQRADLDAVKSDLDKDHSFKRIAEDHFDTWVRHNKAFKEYRRITTKPRYAKPEIYCIIGPTGNNKTRLAHQMAGGEACYVASLGKWFDDYDGETTILFDEFYGHCMPFTTLLKILDWYPLRVETKGGSVQLQASCFIFTSNQDPQDWYNAEKTHQTDWAQNPLKRRLDEFGETIYVGGFVRIAPEIVQGQFGFPQ